jgi:hypothetical protein
MGRTGASLILSALLVHGVATAVLAQDAPAQSSAPKRPADRDQALPKEPEPPVWAPPDLATPAPPAAPAAPQGAAECAKADFEAVVDDAAAALRDLNLKNKPDFQEKLRQLKDKRGWSHDQFMTEAAPYVRDDKIAVFDQESEQLLNDISSLGQEGADANTPDCGLLHELRARMKVLVDTQQAKWTYMFEKLNAALAQ